MGMSDDMDSIAIAMNGIELFVSGVSDYLSNIQSSSDFSYDKSSVSGVIRSSLKPMIALFKKAGLEVEDNDDIDRRISTLTGQVAANLRISGFGWTVAETLFDNDLRNLWLETKNYLNAGPGLPRQRLPGYFLTKADNVISAAEYALSLIDNLRALVNTTEFFDNNKQSNDWLFEMIRVREYRIPYAFSCYLELQRMSNYLHAINTASWSGNLRGGISSMLMESFDRAFNSLTGFSSDFSELALLAEMFVDANNLSSVDMADMRELVSLWESMIGLSSGVATQQKSNSYTIQIVADNKTQTITTLNDPADFLAALTGN